MTALYVAEVLLVLAAIPAMLWLRREGDRAWRRHRMLVMARPIAEAFIRFRIEVFDAFTPALREMALAVAKLIADLERAELTTTHSPRVRVGRNESEAGS